jgi:hypothetical protein
MTIAQHFQCWVNNVKTTRLVPEGRLNRWPITAQPCLRHWVTRDAQRPALKCWAIFVASLSYAWQGQFFRGCRSVLSAR